MRNVKIHGIKKAVSDYKNNHERLHCVIYFDLDDGKVWTDVFADGNSYNDYHSKTIHALNTYMMDACGSELPVPVTMANVRKTAEHVQKLYSL